MLLSAVTTDAELANEAAQAAQSAASAAQAALENPDVFEAEREAAAQV